ncbi:MAG: hypothetical protein IPK13_12675 [Deltaproteobacteria bacterium]|nr:hypothetical protein [Deltaproteobacteria bacterium]
MTGQLGHMGDVEEISDLPDQSFLSFHDRDVLPQGDDSVWTGTLVGLMLELDDLLALGSKYLEASLTNDLIQDIRGSRPWLRADLSFCAAFQFSL